MIAISQKMFDMPVTKRLYIMPAAAAAATKHADEQEPDRDSTSVVQAGRRTERFFGQRQRQQRLQRWSAAAAAMRSAGRSAGEEEHRKLRRRETPQALALAAWRKIEALRAAYLAYREHFKGADAAMLDHLDDAEGAGGSLMTMQEREQLAALKQDYHAWRAYTRTGELPERVFSEGMGPADHRARKI
jgi:hypothetical protein